MLYSKESKKYESIALSPSNRIPSRTMWEVCEVWMWVDRDADLFSFAKQNREFRNHRNEYITYNTVRC